MMVTNRNLLRRASQSAGSFVGMMPLVFVAGILAACESAESVDTTSRMFIAVDMPPLTSDRASTGGISFTDYDGDGDPDIYVTNGYDVSSPDPRPQANRLYENSQGQFVARAVEGLDDVEGFSSGSAWADFDNDGDLDTFIANQRDQENLFLLQESAKDGSVRFVQHAAEEMARDKGWSYSIAAADADNDGFVDFYVSNGGLSHTGENFLYQNLDGASIQRIFDNDAVNGNHASGGASWSDYDGDGDQDLIVANRPTADMQGFKLSLFRNDGNLHSRGWTRTPCPSTRRFRCRSPGAMSITMVTRTSMQATSMGWPTISTKTWGTALSELWTAVEPPRMPDPAMPSVSEISITTPTSI